MNELIANASHLASGAWVLGLAALPVMLVVASVRNAGAARFRAVRLFAVLMAMSLVIGMAGSFGGAFLGAIGETGLVYALTFLAVGVIGALAGFAVLRQIPAFHAAPPAYVAMRAAMAGASLTFVFLWSAFVMFLSASLNDNPLGTPGAVLTGMAYVVPLLGGLAVSGLGFWAAFRKPNPSGARPHRR